MKFILNKLILSLLLIGTVTLATSCSKEEKAMEKEIGNEAEAFNWGPDPGD